jgi:hypothetical protein
MALGSTQPLTEMSTRNLPGGKKRPARRADNLADIYAPKVKTCGSLNLSPHYGPPLLVQGKLYLYLTILPFTCVGSRQPDYQKLGRDSNPAF